MKLHEHFKIFLEDHVNLNATRLNLLENSVEAVKSAVKNSAWEAQIVRFVAQGSWAHGTIIKPQTDKSFDADLLVLVKAKIGWTAKDYVNTLTTELLSLPAYKDKVRRFSHCATIEYVGERKIDIVPCVVDRLYNGQYEVCNRGTDEFESSEPLAYTEWVKEKNGVAGGNDLKKVTRLIKYMRDIKGNFSCPSFLLTTLLGYRISESDRNSSNFSDLTTTLKTLVGRLDDWLQAHSSVPAVPNPVMYGQDQATAWDASKYSNFRDKINLYRGWIDDAFAEQDREESIGKWRRVFGEGFAAGETKRAAEQVSETMSKFEGAVAGNSLFVDLVARVKAFGAAAVPIKLHRLPHIERPKWRRSPEQLIVKVIADLQTNEHSSSLRSVQSAEPLAPFQWLKFTASNSHGLPFSSAEYSVKWRITNTDKVAAQADQLRGEFYSSGEGASRTEKLAYRGVHFVEAFLLRKRDGCLVGQSPPFYVVVE